jgi:hypothetical protein
LEEALQEFQRVCLKTRDKPDDLTAIKLGLKVLSEDITFSGPCTDEGADDVF